MRKQSELAALEWGGTAGRCGTGGERLSGAALPKSIRYSQASQVAETELVAVTG